VSIILGFDEFKVECGLTADIIIIVTKIILLPVRQIKVRPPWILIMASQSIVQGGWLIFTSMSKRRNACVWAKAIRLVIRSRRTLPCYPLKLRPPHGQWLLVMVSQLKMWEVCMVIRLYEHKTCCVKVK
jgi:hypothetical protein